MSSKRTQEIPVDPLDSDYAISEIKNILHTRGMSSTDLAIELGWTRSQVETFLFGVGIPRRSEFQLVADVLKCDLEIE